MWGTAAFRWWFLNRRIESLVMLERKFILNVLSSMASFVSLSSMLNVLLIVVFTLRYGNNLQYQSKRTEFSSNGHLIFTAIRQLFFDRNQCHYLCHVNTVNAIKCRILSEFCDDGRIDSTCVSHHSERMMCE